MGILTGGIMSIISANSYRYIPSSSYTKENIVNLLDIVERHQFTIAALQEQVQQLKQQIKYYKYNFGDIPCNTPTKTTPY